MHVDWGTLGSSLSLQMGIPGYLSERGIGKECKGGGKRREGLSSPAARQKFADLSQIKFSDHH